MIFSSFDLAQGSGAEKVLLAPEMFAKSDPAVA